MNWKTLVNVARFQLVDRTSYTVLPWAVLIINFAIYFAGAAAAGRGSAGPAARMSLSFTCSFSSRAR